MKPPLLLLVALAVTLLCACGKSPVWLREGREPPSPLTGVWMREGRERCVLRLWSDGTAAIIKDPNAEPAKSKWTSSDKTLTITGPDGDVLVYTVVSVSKTHLSLELANGEQSNYERFTP
jgi:hypothetical protein